MRQEPRGLAPAAWGALVPVAATAVLLLLQGCGLLLPEAARIQPATENPFCRAIGGIAGAEDVTVHAATGLAYASSTDRRAWMDGDSPASPDGRVGHLYRLDLSQEPPRSWDVTPEALRDGFAPHGISLLPRPDGGALLFVIDHGAARDERSGQWRQDRRLPSKVHLLEIPRGSRAGERLTLRRTIVLDRPASPNDIAALNEQRFYVTNEHGGAAAGTLRDLLGLNDGFVGYHDETGMRWRRGLPWANGIAVDPERQRLYVASSSRGTVTTLSIADPANPAAIPGLDPLPTGTGLDNIEFDPTNGDLVVAAHPARFRLLLFSERLLGVRGAPSQVLRIPRDAAGTPGRPREVLRQDGDETRPGEVAAASVAAVDRSGPGGGARLILGSIFSSHVLVCQEPAARRGS